MRILVTGAGGLLAHDLIPTLQAEGHEVFGLTRERLDITSYLAVKDAMRVYTPEVIINCAAFTDVQGAERLKETCYQVNTVGPMILAELAEDRKLIHISSDYCFNQSTPISPTTFDHKPLNVYGDSKAKAEAILCKTRAYGSDEWDPFTDDEMLYVWVNTLIVRTSGLYGAGGRNFVDAIRTSVPRPSVTDKQITSITWSKNLSLFVANNLNVNGVIHYTDGGEASWYEIAKEIREDTILFSSESCTVRRPKYSVLEVEHKNNWKDSLKEYLTQTESRHIITL